MKMNHKVLHCILMSTLVFENCLWAESSNKELCNWCLCVKDKSTWMPDPDRGWDDSGRLLRTDPNALLVNCSGINDASPFAGEYGWPDVPMHRTREDQAQGPKTVDVPATRADFSSCNLVGAMRSLPVKETRRLKELSLSHNHITDIQSGALMGLPALRFLDLGHNKLATVTPDSLPLASELSMASNLKVLILRHNELPRVPWEALLRMPKLERLDLSSNYIHSIENGFNGIDSELLFESVKALNLKHNLLTDLSTKAASRFPYLEDLDLSWNNIEAVPDAFLTTVNTTLMNLSSLNLDGNPIKKLGPNSFVGTPSVRHLFLSASAELSEISSEAFDGLHDLRVLKMRKNVLLSHLPSKGILWETFKTGGSWALEEVDLSYNSLEYITAEFLPWKDIKSVNLQGNPWNCNCSLQWMLDGFMPNAYKMDSSLLFDLRCYKPKWLQGRRFVHWLGRSNGVYCGNMMEKLKMGIQQADAKDVDLVAMGMSSGMIAVVASVTVLVVGLLVLAVVLQRRATRLEKEMRTNNYQCRNPRY